MIGCAADMSYDPAVTRQTIERLRIAHTEIDTQHAMSFAVEIYGFGILILYTKVNCSVRWQEVIPSGQDMRK